MAVLKLVRGEYRNEDAMDNLVHYILNTDKMPNACFGGTGVVLSCPSECMYAMKQTFGKLTGKMAEHLIIAFNEDEISNLTIQKIFSLAYDVCDYFEGVQVLFGLHEYGDIHFEDDFDVNNLHIHFAINTIDVRTGNKFRIDYNNEFQLKNYVLNLMYNYGIGDTVKLVVH